MAAPARRATPWCSALALALACGLVPLAGKLGAQDIDPTTRASEEAAARTRLEAVRSELRELVAEQRRSREEREGALAELRQQELAVAQVAREVAALDQRLAAEQARLAALDAERAQLEEGLRGQRAALAALLRSGYVLGRHAELKLLLAQEDMAGIARVLAYQRYYQRHRSAKIEALLADLAELARVAEAAAAAQAALAATRAERATEVARLEAARAEHQRVVAGLDQRLGDQAARAAALGRDERSLGQLLERLRDVFADIPRQLPAAQAFASLRGRLDWPLRGRVVRAFGAPDEAGRPATGILIAVSAGKEVKAVSHGRVAFADWLRGYGLLLILDHGDGYLSLYGGNESLLREVGDWVDAGQPVATSGASGGQSEPALYFELRAAGTPVDPRGWLRK